MSHDPSEIILICWFAAQEIFIIIINVENSHTDTKVYLVLKTFFYYNVKVYTNTFEQFNAALLNNFISSKKNLTLNFWTLLLQLYFTKVNTATTQKSHL